MTFRILSEQRPRGDRVICQTVFELDEKIFVLSTAHFKPLLILGEPQFFQTVFWEDKNIGNSDVLAEYKTLKESIDGHQKFLKDLQDGKKIF